MVMQSRYTSWSRFWRAALVVSLIAMLYASRAAADEVTSKGTVLRGTVTALTGAGITFSPEYGKGTLAIKWESIENVKTEAPLQVLYGDGQETDAPLQGFSNGKLLVGTTTVDVVTIHSGQPIGAGGLSFRLHEVEILEEVSQQLVELGDLDEQRHHQRLDGEQDADHEASVDRRGRLGPDLCKSETGKDRKDDDPE